MRQFKNHEAVKVNNAEEAMKFLKYLADNTDLKWYSGGKISGLEMEKSSRTEHPFFFEVFRGKLLFSDIINLEDETKVIPLSEFIKPKVTYTRKQAEKMFEDYNKFHNFDQPLDRTDIAFLNHKFPKSTLEQVTEAVKDLGDFTIEQTTTGEIIISPINK